ncbi:MAG TPA: O-antigen ligase family protein, partial [Dehalococcoidia bacterium]|nr:O-antigen ligase family protein [Dehalococcoidia bacterium]
MQNTSPVALGTAAAVVLAGFTGLLLVRHPESSIFLTAAIAAAGILLATPAPLPLVVGTCVFVLSGLIDAPGQFSVAGFSGLAAGTVALSVMATLVVVREHDRLPASAVRALAWWTPCLAFVACVALVGHPTAVGIQNFLMLALFVLTIALFSLAPRSVKSSDETTERWFMIATIGAVALGVAATATGGVGGVESGDIVGPRSLALGLLPVLAWALSAARNGSVRHIALVGFLVGAIGFTLSRTAFAVALILVAAALYRRYRLAYKVRLILASITLAAGAFWLVTSVGTFQERFSSGDVSSLSTRVSINVSGRDDLWALMMSGIRESPFFGHGLGASQSRIEQVFNGAIAHPHNDYLR